MQVLCKIGIVPIFKRGATLFFFLFLFSSFVFGGINNINLPHLIPDEPIPDIIIEGANYSININRTNYWDNLNSPADISLGDLNGAEQSIWDFGFIGLANITQTFVQSLGFYLTTEVYNITEIDTNFTDFGSWVVGLNGTWEDLNTQIGNCSVDGSCPLITYDSELNYTDNTDTYLNATCPSGQMFESINGTVYGCVSGSGYSDDWINTTIDAEIVNVNLSSNNYTDNLNGTWLDIDTQISNCSIRGDCTSIPYMNNSNSIGFFNTTEMYISTIFANNESNSIIENNETCWIIRGSTSNLYIC